MLSGVTHVNRDAQGAQPCNRRALTLIGAGDGVPQTCEHLSDTAHAGATDTHHKDVTNAPHARYDPVWLNHLHTPPP